MFLKTKSSGATLGAEQLTAAARPKVSAVPSIVSADLTVSGNLKSEGDIQVDGTVEGDIESRTLTIGENAEVRGGVMAETIRVCGAVHGEVRGHRIVLTRTAKVRGDVLHHSLEIEAGAFLEGHCRRLTNDELKASTPGFVAARSNQQQRDAAAAKARAGAVSALDTTGEATPGDARKAAFSTVGNGTAAAGSSSPGNA